MAQKGLHSQMAKQMPPVVITYIIKRHPILTEGVCLSVCLTLPVCLSVCMSVCLSVCLCVCLSVCLYGGGGGVSFICCLYASSSLKMSKITVFTIPASVLKPKRSKITVFTIPASVFSPQRFQITDFTIPASVLT